MITSRRCSTASPAITLAVTWIWHCTLVSTTVTSGAPATGVQVPGVTGTQVIELIETVAGVGTCTCTAVNPQTLVKPATVEQALTLNDPPGVAVVMVTKPVA